MEKLTKEIGKEIKTEIQKLKGVKLSVKTDSNNIDVNIMAAPFKLLLDESGYQQINHYYYNESDKLTREGKIIFQLIDEIIKKYYWDKSDIQSDYFNCAFYYNYAVGRWNKPFQLVN